jgi:hypothetical protein
LRHFATPRFWACYRTLPTAVQRLADEKYDLLKTNPQHPSLHLKRVGRIFSVRIGLHYRALGAERPDGIAWFWIGSHAEYDRIIA